LESSIQYPWGAGLHQEGTSLKEISNKKKFLSKLDALNATSLATSNSTVIFLRNISERETQRRRPYGYAG